MEQFMNTFMKTEWSSVLLKLEKPRILYVRTDSICVSAEHQFPDVKIVHQVRMQPLLVSERMSLISPKLFRRTVVQYGVQETTKQINTINMVFSNLASRRCI